MFVSIDVANRTSSTLDVDGLEKIKEIHNTFEHCEFPEDKYDTAFSTTCIYWKVNGEDEKSESVEDEDKDKVKEKDERNGVAVKGDEDELSKKLESTTIS